MLPLRQLVLAAALVATLAASFVDFSALQPEPEAVGTMLPVVAFKAPPPQPPAAAASSPLPKQSRARFEPEPSALFAAHSWQPPPPPAPKAAPPTAPALPFRYLGKVQDNGQITVFLAQSARTHVLKKGDTLPGYKVEDITMAQMTFVYLPLNEKQTLIFGSAN